MKPETKKIILDCVLCCILSSILYFAISLFGAGQVLESTIINHSFISCFLFNFRVYI